MRFSAEHRFHGPPDAVTKIVADPDFYTALALPDLSPPIVVEHRSDEQGGHVRLRYEFVGSLNSMARRLIGSKRLFWVQEVRVDFPAGPGTLTFQAEADPGRLHGSATFTIHPDGDTTVRRLEGELTVKVPLVGSKAERQIVPGIVRRLDIEAAALDERLRQGPSS